MAPARKLTLEPGDKIGDYDVLAPLGAGGMGSVYKVRHAISQRVEALKIILPDAAQSPEMADRFLREIRLLACLEHPHIAALHNAFRHHEDLVMVMEFVEGVSLREKLRTSGITLGQALEYAVQVLAALECAHNHGVIHRDIKPSNVMIAAHGMVKLLDFGLASQLATAGDVEMTLTQPGTMLGTPHYISPEQARGERADARSDIYSTGAMLYEMAAGRTPFQAQGGAFAVIAAHLHDAPQSPAEINTRLSDALAQVILKALAKNPGDRFQTASEFLTALKSVAADEVRLNDTVTAVMQPAPPTPDAPTASGNATSYDPRDLDRISKELAAFIGPIAHILVRRAAAQSRSFDDLYQTLAGEISSVAKRDQFLAGMQRAPLSRSAAGMPSGGSRTSD
ncbi:MAG TPA: serine/threonine-protein kinase [Bryobacteraceae bacterium]|nr:serine/threonine-protein kinase [Bryobacteraceae bacterium]